MSLSSAAHTANESAASVTDSNRDETERWQSDLSRQLDAYRGATLDRMKAAIPQREPRQYLYDPLHEYLSRAGKSVRPALCLATCRAYGGDEKKAGPSASALEMLHNAFLVHDDIEDESEFRRGIPTLHIQQGVPLAVNSGDMMNALSMRMLRNNATSLDPQVAQRVLEEFDHLLVESLEGQAMELGWIRDNRADISEDDYLRMALKKTCWYSFIHPVRIGALIARPDRMDLDRFNRFGYYLGVAFQIQDDLLNLVGERDRYGKEIGGDLLEGKRTLMLIHLLRRLNDPERSRVLNFLGLPRKERHPGDVDWILGRMKSLGSLEFGRSASRQFAGAALFEFERAFADASESEHKTFIHHIIRYMIARDQ